jgi:hypothetical protein
MQGKDRAKAVVVLKELGRARAEAEHRPQRILLRPGQLLQLVQHRR